MIFSWRARRQLAYLGALLLSGLVVAGTVYFFSRSPASCHDGRQNQKEEGVDCGGLCTPCLGNVQEPVVQWSRFFPVGEHAYDAAALLESNNLSAGAKKITYRFKLYDAQNILIAVREGSTFLRPRDRLILFEPNIDAGFREPRRVATEIDPIAWVYEPHEALPLIVARQIFETEPFGRLTLEIRNTALVSVHDTLVQAVLYDETDNAIAASETTVAELPGQKQIPIFLTWPHAFFSEPARIEIFLRALPH